MSLVKESKDFAALRPRLERTELDKHLISYASQNLPMELRLVRDAFDHADYVFELKQDGFRGMAASFGHGAYRGEKGTLSMRFNTNRR